MTAPVTDKVLYGVRFAPQLPYTGLTEALFGRPQTRFVRAYSEDDVRKFVSQRFPGSEVVRVWQVTELHEQPGGTWDVLKDPLLPKP